MNFTNSTKCLLKLPRRINSNILFNKSFQQRNISSIPKISLTCPEKYILNSIEQAAKSGSPGFFYLTDHGINSSVFEVIDYH